MNPTNESRQAKPSNQTTMPTHGLADASSDCCGVGAWGTQLVHPHTLFSQSPRLKATVGATDVHAPSDPHWRSVRLDVARKGAWGSRAADIAVALHTADGNLEQLRIYRHRQGGATIASRTRRDRPFIDEYEAIDSLAPAKNHAFPLYVSLAPLIDEEWDDEVGGIVHAESREGLVRIAVVPHHAEPNPIWLYLDPDPFDAREEYDEDGELRWRHEPCGVARVVSGREAKRIQKRWKRSTRP